VKVIKEKLEDGIEFVDHLCYATKIDGFVFRSRMVVTLVTCIRGQIRKTIDPVFGSVVILRCIAQLFLPD